MSLLERVSDSIEEFTADHEAFKAACDKAFRQADKDGNGTLSPVEVASKVDDIFQEIADVLATAHISVERPKQEAVQLLLEGADIDGDLNLDREEFKNFYEQARDSIFGCCNFWVRS